MRETTGALQGLRIIDLSHAMAGPFCTQLLADHGAEVIKIEPPGGDFFRKSGPYRADDTRHEYGGFFAACNRNKRGIVIDLKQAEGRALLRELIAGADAVVENFRAGVMDRMGLGYESLAALNPRLVYTSIRGFGDRRGGESPYVNWPSFDIVAQAMGGWMGVTGPDADHPSKVGGGAADTISGLFGAFGTMTALWRARATGQGQYVDVSMVDNILALSELVTSLFSYTGHTPQPTGNGIPGLTPFGTFRARDGIVSLAAPHQPQWIEFCRLIDREDLIADPRFVDEKTRARHKDELNALIEAFTSTRTKEELKTLLGGKIPFGPIYTGEDIFKDEHFKVRDMLPQLSHPGSATPVQVPGIPVKLIGTPGSIRRRAPCLGEHTEEVLHELGLSAERIAALQAAGVVSLPDTPPAP